MAAMTKMKSSLDYVTFTLVQAAATAALKEQQCCVVEKKCLMYRQKGDVLSDGLRQKACEVLHLPSIMFAWDAIRLVFRGSIVLRKCLLCEAWVAVAPGMGLGVGEHGDSNVCIALVENEHCTRQALRSLKVFSHSSESLARWVSPKQPAIRGRKVAL